eukprot:TRINITY_DN7984_c0_g1_i1.p1 TRINITY_DN7984_c0_g1~~TRINITY_DN7984_c0_g1_i1.p1  ORF type:complete len:383 (-),score=34.38 TRINITY_DN7984_c0_g1_i1:710-1858(-)
MTPFVFCIVFLFLCVESVQGDKCNGASEFCSLSVFDYTFPATHNAGSYKLTTPANLKSKWYLGMGGDVIKSCYYENHNLDVTGQLNTGIRAFSIDFCGKKAETGDWLCHGQYDDEGYIAFGGGLREYFGQIKSWLTSNPREVIVLLVENVKRTDSLRWFRAVKSVFGSCRTSYDYAVFGNSQSLGCVWLKKTKTYGDDMTLGNLIASGHRVLVTDWMVVATTSWSKAANEGLNTERLYSHLSDWTKSNMDKPMLAWYVFATLHIPDFTQSKFPSLTQTSVRCNQAYSQDVNSFFFPADSAENVHPSLGAAPCYGTCGCLGYKSRLEALHQSILDKGKNIMFVMADYTNYGHFTETIRRMNFATVRRRQSINEPGTPRHKCGW